MFGIFTRLLSTLMTPQAQPKNPNPGTYALDFQQWGWRIRLCKKGTATALLVSTPSERGYSLEVDEAGNVVEHISGNYLRVVEGTVEERILGASIQETVGPRILRSREYMVIAAPQVHFNPEEFKSQEG